jgi:hypothetical protein
MNEKPVRVIPLEKLLQYNISVQVYNGTEDIPTMDFCNGFTVRNIGTSNLVVNGDQLAPNESKAIGGNRGEIFVGRIYITFNGAGNNLALITQKFYMNVPFENDSNI